MKNVYISTCLLILISITCTGQNLQNANWYFGQNGGIKFFGSATSPLSGGQLTSDEGCASVSDQSGNLLFYTNGVNVWNRLHQIMPNGSGLNGNISSTQNAVIVPKPGNSNRYYIFTIDGVSGSNKGLYYSEVDMTLNGGLGDLVYLNSTDYVIPLKDHMGISIDSAYGNDSEKITTTAHANGVDYWVVTQIKDRIYSYLVNASGILLNFSSIATIAIPSTHSLLNNGAIGAMKISPNTRRIGINYITTANGTSQTVLGSFDNYYGEVTLERKAIAFPLGAYGLEFSPDSKNVFIFGNSYICYTTVSSVPLTVINTGAGNTYSGAQLGLDGKIYFTSDNSKLSVINDPNNLSAPNIQYNTVTVSGTPRLGLPQWVSWQEGTCNPQIVLSDPETSWYRIYKASVSITTDLNYTIEPGSDITLRAQEFIVLKPDTHVKSGATLLARIQFCSDVPISKPTSTIEKPEKTQYIASPKLRVAPNPANSTATVIHDDLIKKVTVISLDGKLMLEKEVAGEETSFDIPVGQYENGIFIITVITGKDEIVTSKLVKN